MSIAWNAFTPASALIGGAIIGAAAALFAVLNGRIAGVSGILGGLARPQAGDLSWRIAFVAGLVAAPLVWAFLAALPEIRVDSSYPALVAAGLLVGIGTRYGGGCTSGHGVCGVSRLSPRSIAATFAFIAAGFATVFVARHLIAP
ncbi:MAG: YeeE/YedE family protein [Betaproteobacteria bacterium]|nr:MAG: YeeE/YedE family protein [Betaproteobacteria bacterium]